MGEVTIIGIDLAKNVFQVHGAAADGSVLFRKKLSRPQFARFMADQPPCLVAMEACASAQSAGAARRVQVLLENGQVYGQPARLLFTDLSVDPTTGQVNLRAEVPNPGGLLMPGMYTGQ